MKILEERDISPRIDFNIEVTGYDEVRYISPRLKKSKIPMRVPITVDDMIIKFERDGWNFSSEDRSACRSLLKEVNFYTFKYYVKKERVSCFSEAKEIYEFDAFLQNTLQELTCFIEIFLRTVTVDVLSLTYAKEEHSFDPAQFYLDDELYFTEKGKHRKTNQRNKEIESLKYEFFKIYEKNKNSPPVIKEIERYETISAWVLFDFMTFGQLSFFYSKLVTKYKRVVSKELNNMSLYDERITEQLLSSWMNSIRSLRNKVSHGSKIYGEPFTVLGKIHESDESFLEYVDDSRKNHVVNIFFSMRRIIMCMSTERIKLWNCKIIEIDNKIKKSNFLNYESLGLAKDWLEHFKISDIKSGEL